MKCKIIIFNLLSLITLLSLFSFSKLDSDNGSIIGSWVSESDPKSKLIFSLNGKCKEYYDGILQDEYTYIINNTSPQCDTNVHVDQHTSYLQKMNVNDPGDIYCYEINGITSTILSLRFVGNGGFMIYNRDCTLDSDKDGYNDCEDPNNAVNNTTITSNFTEDKGGWLNNGNVATTLEEGRLKVSDVDSSWEGVRRPLDELRIAPGQQLNISFDFDQGNTQAGVRVYIQELDAEGNHILWNVFDSSTPTGHHNYTYTIKTGDKAILRIDKDNTHLEETTHFYVDNIEVKLLDCTLDSDDDGYNDCTHTIVDAPFKINSVSYKSMNQEESVLSLEIDNDGENIVFEHLDYLGKKTSLDLKSTNNNMVVIEARYAPTDFVFSPDHKEKHQVRIRYKLNDRTMYSEIDAKKIISVKSSNI